jgi:tellurite resistance protein TehA-like permease
VKTINSYFAFLLGIGACALTLELLRYLSERNGNDHLRAMLGAVALVVGGTVIHVVVLHLFGLIEEPPEPNEDAPSESTENHPSPTSSSPNTLS